MIWPETSLPYLLNNATPVLQEIAQATPAQVVLGVIDRGLDLQAAIDAPRMHLETDTPQVLDFEDTGPESRRAALLAAFPDANVWPSPRMFFGGVHAVRRTAKGSFEAAGDARRSGAVLTQ